MNSTTDLYEIFLRHPQAITDSRQVTPGCLFFALKGSNFDGNQFAAAALEKGAAYAVVDDPSATRDVDARFIVVPDVLTALQDLARHHRRRFSGPVIGITGSNGKTTTKELVSGVLGAHYRIHFTKGNFNNHIGVPLTLLAMPLNAEIAVIEMGANHQGEIDTLSRIAEPSHGIITNIGKAHLEGFGGLEGVKKGKSELYRYLAEEGGIALINAEESFLTELAAPVKRKVFYGRGIDAPDGTSRFFPVELLETQPFLQVGFKDETGTEVSISSQLCGVYNFGNIATAIAVGQFFGVPCRKIRQAIEAYVPENMRSQVIQRGANIFILDAYNANPTSTKAALLSFGQMHAAKKIAILGDMLELGEYAEEEHRKIASLAKAQGLETVILVGPLYAQAAAEENLAHFADVSALQSWLKQQNFEETYFLIKGSRGIKLEQLLGLNG